MLERKGLSTYEISHAIGISERLVREYLDPYQHHQTPLDQAPKKKSCSCLREALKKLALAQKRATIYATKCQNVTKRIFHQTVMYPSGHEYKFINTVPKTSGILKKTRKWGSLP
ncbi:MAG: hypothetical protein R6U51_04960 [Anaerolineales bacterium]